MSDEEREVQIQRVKADGTLISSLVPGQVPYMNIENLYAVVGKRPDGGEAILFMPMGLVSDVLAPELKKMAAHAADHHDIETKLVRFVRAEVVEVFEP